MRNIFVAGHNGMVGSAICRQLAADSDVHLIRSSRTNCDLRNQAQVNDFFANNAIDEVYLAAAKVGGIHANNEYPAEFIYENLMIQANIIHAAYAAGVNKLLFLGSSCIYPKLAEQPMPEQALLTGLLESTNEPYAIAKIAGIKLCESFNRQYGVDFRSVMPTNLYGEGDNFHPENSHVIPAMMQRFHNAAQQGESEVVVWGSGKPMRTIRELAETIAEVVGFQGELVFDKTKPDGTPRKLMNVSRLKSLGWQSSISLKKGLEMTYQWFLQNQQKIRK